MKQLPYPASELRKAGKGCTVVFLILIVIPISGHEFMASLIPFPKLFYTNILLFTQIVFFYFLLCFLKFLFPFFLGIILFGTKTDVNIIQQFLSVVSKFHISNQGSGGFLLHRVLIIPAAVRSNLGCT